MPEMRLCKNLYRGLYMVFSYPENAMYRIDGEYP